MSKVSFVSCWMVNNYRAWIQRLFLLICELNVDMAIWHVRNNITHGEGQDHLEHLFISRSCIGKNCVLLPIRHNDSYSDTKGNPGTQDSLVVKLEVVLLDNIIAMILGMRK